MDNYRIKVTYNFDSISTYNACKKIRDLYIIMYEYNNSQIISCTYQYCPTTDAMFLIIQFVNNPSFCYWRGFLNNHKHLINSVYMYTSEEPGLTHIFGQEHFIEYFMNIKLELSPDNFIQCNQHQKDNLYNTVKDIVINNINSIKNIYIFGDIVHHAKMFEYLPVNIYGYTNSQAIINDTHHNCLAVITGNYSDFDTVKPKSIAIINPGKKGISRYVNVSSKLDQFLHVVFVYCNEKKYEHDTQFIPDHVTKSKTYIDMFPDTIYKEIVAHHTMKPTYISLSGLMGCAIAYQLLKRGMRDAAYPFDWIRVKSFSSLKGIFENMYDMINIEKLEKIENNSKFPLIVDDHMTNDASEGYRHVDLGIEYRHDGSIDEIVQKYKRRINRYNELVKSGRELVFIRDELKIVSLDEIYNLCEILPGKLKMICRTNQKGDNDDRVTFYKIYKKKVPIGDWKRDEMEWSTYF